MAEATEREQSIPVGDFEVQVGRSYKPRRVQYHALRYDFKSKSSTGGNAETYMAIGGNGDVQVAVPSEGDALTLYKGSQKNVKNDKECLLIYDPKTRTLRLEKLNSHIVLKKTRDNDPEVETAFKTEIDKLRQNRSSSSHELSLETASYLNRMSPEPEAQSASAASQLHMSTSDSSSSSDDSENSNSSDDEDDSDSERLMGEMEKLNTTTEAPPSMAQPEPMMSSDESMSDSDDDVDDMLEKQLNAAVSNEPKADDDSMPDFDELMMGVSSSQERSSPQEASRPSTASPRAQASPQHSQTASFAASTNMLHDDLQLSESSEDEE
ncbi:hypothetical protein QR680_009395 [Steinernema hermaphroditum]|uniref:Ell-associated factor Eaf n=1 Tax=Steinernema hermaphroditum TaxID=289476 RepID=A0AA39IMJ2_9BILA|nr:hypothetical protein QR680_009395 [Steinernema hermaphroditum]